MAGSAFRDERTSKGLEPGLLRMVRLLLTVQVIALPFVRRVIGTGVGVETPALSFYVLTLPFPVLLAMIAWLPSWNGRRGLILLAVTCTLESMFVIGDKFVTLVWMVPDSQRELVGLALIVRAWLIFHAITLLVAWQYRWRVALIWACALVAGDLALSLPLVQRGGPSYRLFLVLSVARATAVPAVAAGVGWLLERQREQRTALADANRNLADANQKLAAYAATTEQLAVSRERNRLARELHDTLAHSLSAVTVQLEAIEALWEVNAASAQTMLSSALQNARCGLTEARRALHALRASPLDDVGLSVAIGDLARSAAARAKLRLVLNAPPNGLGLRSDQEQFLYRVAQEAMANVVRHAQATELRVTLERTNGDLTLVVADDGVGFERGAVDASAHFGLQGIQERVEMMGGQLSVDSGSGRGTTLRVGVPVGSAA